MAEAVAERPRAVVLLSGGVDLATDLAIAREPGFDPRALSVGHGQRYFSELASAAAAARDRRLAKRVNARVDLCKPGGSALSADIALPEGRCANDIAHGIPLIGLLARNTVVPSCAPPWTETPATADIFIGANTVDYFGYPDCRTEPIAARETVADLAAGAGRVDPLYLRFGMRA